jgi:uncharacterized protein YgbK (DUF1537 family)
MNWDLRYDNPPATSHGYDISATPYLTPATPQGPLVIPGVYTVTLTVDGKKYVQKVTVKNDPRSPASAGDVLRQHELQMALYNGDVQATAGNKALTELRAKIEELQNAKLPKDVAAALSALSDKLDDLGKATSRNQSFRGVQSQTISYLAKMEFGDMAPSQPVRDAVMGLETDLKKIVKAWNEVQDKDIKSLNVKLKANALPALPLGMKL